MVRRLERTARRRGYLKWRPLVSLEGFERSMDTAIAALGADTFRDGTYLEFGVSRGTSMLGAYQAFERAGVSPKMIGFDSFEGMPEGSEAEGWNAGEYASSQAATTRYLKRGGMDMSRLTLVPGWFDDTLTSRTRADLGISHAPILMIDCDIFSASKLALDFAYPLMANRTVIVFDDWGPMERLGKIGQKEAFAAFLEEHPELDAQPLSEYDFEGNPNGRVFLLERS